MFHNRYIGNGYDDVVYRDQVDGEQIVETKLREDADPRDDYNIASVKMVKDAVSGGGGDTPVKDLIPEDASEDNKLVTENGDQMKVSAAAFNELNARVAAIEAALASGNLGSVIADSIDTQVLKVGGEDINTIIQNAIGG